MDVSPVVSTICVSLHNLHTDYILAGGYDAIALLVIDIETPTDEAESTPIIARIERLWQRWTELDVSPLSTEVDKYDGEEHGGVRLET